MTIIIGGARHIAPLPSIVILFVHSPTKLEMRRKNAIAPIYTSLATLISYAIAVHWRAGRSISGKRVTTAST
ncbi:hypothetical protein [Allocoleopsis sp.]|uniref:hypothetical protein n=1 Tax=Allocoleopsis sp. TaxID=3088169 RepID=UPI002FD35161